MKARTVILAAAIAAKPLETKPFVKK